MIANVTPVLTDTALAFAAVVTILTALGFMFRIVARTRPSRWFWRTLVGDPLSKWFRAEVTEAVKETTADIVDPKIRQLDEGQLTMREQLGQVAAQLLPNHGASIADAVVRIEGKLDAHLEDSETRTDQFNQIIASGAEMGASLAIRLDRLEGS